MIDLAACYFHKSTYESITFFSIFLTTFLRRESKKGERGFFFVFFLRTFENLSMRFLTCVLVAVTDINGLIIQL